MKTTWRYLWKAFVVTLATLAGMAVAGRLVLDRFDVGWENPPDPAELLLPSLIAGLLTVAALIYPVTRSTLRGGRLYLAVFAAVFGINVVLIQIEAAVFLRMTADQLTAGFLHGTLHAALVTLLVVAAFGREERPARSVSWRVRG